jgi:acyl-CoA synthetase (AMP-forming)/AMP-acid ligase II
MIWLKQYPQGMPAEVDVAAYASLVDLLRHSCERFAKLPAYSSMGVVMLYGELDRASQDFATYLRQALGLQQGDRVAIMLPNLLQYPVALFGILRAGLVVVNVNPLYTASELAHQLRDSGAAAIIVLENFAHTLQVVLDSDPALRPVVITTEVGDLFPLVRELMTNLVVKYVRHLVPAWHIPGAIGFNAALRMGHALSHHEVTLTLEDTAFLQYTSGLKVASAGGMAVQRVVAERWQRATGTTLVEGYGLTETSPVVMSNRLDTAQWTGAIGLPLPSTLAVILDEQGHELPTGEVGEIAVRGPQVMRGYWNRPDETAAVFTADGWLRTGDLGFMDERGYFWMTDRKKDSIVVSGFKVCPNQIEDVVAPQPADA